MFRKKTEIVLSHANLMALFVAFDALKACFGKPTFRDSTIRKENKESMDYEVEIWGKTHAMKMDCYEPPTFHSLVTFSLRGTDQRLWSDDLIKIKILGWSEVFELHFTKGKYVVSEKSLSSLDFLKKEMHRRQQRIVSPYLGPQ